MNEFYINLQMFADNTTTSTGLAAEMPSEFWKNRLISKAKAKLYHNQFGDTYDIPANNGKTVQMRLRNHYAKATSTLNEMDAGDGQLISVDEVTATVGLYGKYTKLSALLTWTSKDNLHASEQDELAYQAARSIDTLTRDVLVGGSNVYYAPSVATDGTATAITARANLTALCKLNTKLLFKVAALLGANDVPQFEGGYVGIIHPEAAFDIKTDTNFVDVVKYKDASKLYDGEIGKMAGIRFVESSEAKVYAPGNIMTGICRLTVKTAASTGATEITVNEAISAADAATFPSGGVDVYINGATNKISAVTAGVAGSAKVTVTALAADVGVGKMICGQGAGKDGSAVYATLILGQHAYGTTKLENGGLEFITMTAEQIGGPLKLYSTAGWKATHVAKRLQETNMVRIESANEFSADTIAN